MTRREEFPSELKGLLRTQQIIMAALPAGLFFFLLIAILDRFGGNQPADLFGILTLAAVAYAAMSLVAQAVVPRMITGAARRRIAQGTWQPPGLTTPQIATLLKRTGTSGQFMLVNQLRLILGGAILDGAAFFVVLAYFLEGSPIALGVAVLLITALLLKFPTAGRVGDWIENQRRRMEEDQLLSGAGS